MSRYDYMCDKCKKIKEVERPITAPQSPVMCDCGAVMLRLYSAPAIEFRGEGWQSNEVKNK